MRKVIRYKKRFFLVVCLVCLLGCVCCAWADNENFESDLDFEPVETPTYTVTPAPDQEPSLTPEQETSEKGEESDNSEDTESNNKIDNESDNSGTPAMKSGSDQQDDQAIDYTQKLDDIEDKLLDLHNDNFKLMICVFVLMGSLLGFLVVREMLK